MLNVKQMLQVLEPKNQNLPEIKLEANAKGDSRVNVMVFEGEEKETGQRFADLKKEKLSGKKKGLSEVVGNKVAYWVHGMGKRGDMTPRRIRRFFGQTYLASLSSKPKTVVIECPPQWAKWAAVGIHVAALNPAMFKKEAPKEKAPQVILVHPDFKASSAKVKKELKEGLGIAEGKNLMRLLGAFSPNDLNPTTYPQIIKALAKQWGVKMKQCSKKELEKYELLNAVSLGSVHDSQLVILTLDPPKGKTKNSTITVGKGLCFDAGGIMVKPGDYMRHMKQDMAGSAALLGTILTMIRNKHNVKQTTHFLLPLAENMLGERATKPDDVWTTGDGQKVEILHTDAEGRLVMADAICYAKNNFKNANRFVTIATLTGSCVAALGDIYTGVICNDEAIRQEVVRLGQETGDLMFPAPWDMEYDDMNSPIADVANLGENARDGGWIKAGLFLNRFIPKPKNDKEKIEFCHLDIAGSIDMGQAGKPWRRKGLSSGIAVGFLAELLGE